MEFIKERDRILVNGLSKEELCSLLYGYEEYESTEKIVILPEEIVFYKVKLYP